MAPKPPDLKSGARQPMTTTSSPSTKGDKDSQQAKKRVKAMDLSKAVGLENDTSGQVSRVGMETNSATGDATMTDKPATANAWMDGSNHLFDRSNDWYVADYDSEDIADVMRAENEEIGDEEDDPLCPPIIFSAAEKARFRREWRSALIVKGLGRKVSYLPPARRLNYLWAKHGEIQITDMQNGCYLVRFREKDDYEAAVAGGPWLLGDTYLTVHRWHKEFKPWNAEVKTAMAWVQLLDLLVEFYHPEAVMRIASRIGQPVRVNRATEECARAKYARVCVEIDLTKPLLPKYKINGVKYLISYEGLEDLCTVCGRYGAPTHRCCCQEPPPEPESMEEVSTNDVNPTQEEKDNAYGTWMIKTKARRRGRRVPQPYLLQLNRMWPPWGVFTLLTALMRFSLMTLNNQLA
ncbi:hypothetical protein LINGRAHAP2_LOCUS10643 [Linum grandiflorum]